MSENMLRGPQWGPLSSVVPRTASFSGAQRVALAQGRYYDSVYNRKVYWAANQAATAWSVALAATYTGLVISNPPNSNTNLVPLLAGFALSVAPAGIASMHFIGGYAVGGITAHTTPIDAHNAVLDSEGAGAGKADAAATLVGTPRYILPFMGGFTAAALPSTSPSLLDLGGLVIVPPGAYFALGALTAVTGFGALFWEEVPILPS